jgi:hypothetical protein
LTINGEHAILWVMKKQILSFVVEQPKHRAHRVLFQNNTPFKPKTVQSKVLYNRKPKHSKQEF